MLDSAKVADFWGNNAENKPKAVECHWTDSDIIMKHYIHPTITGTMHENWFIWVKNNYFKVPAEKALSLGCGDGCLERHGASANVFKHCDAFDIAQRAIEIAKEKAREMDILEKVHYEALDLNNITLEKNRYDVVFCSMSLHHIVNLERLFREIEKSLKDDGLLIINEYIGPNRFQWTDLQLEISNDLLKILPEKYRHDPITNSIRKEISRTTVEYMDSIDPSEAVRSRDIIPLMEQRFDVINRIDYGGTLVNLLLDNIIVNFDERKSEDLAILKLLFYLEKKMISNEMLPSDFTMIVSRKKRNRNTANTLQKLRTLFSS